MSSMDKKMNRHLVSSAVYQKSSNSLSRLFTITCVLLLSLYFNLCNAYDAEITCPKTLCLKKYSYWRGFAREALGVIPPCISCTYTYSSSLTPQEQWSGSSVGIIHSAPSSWNYLNMTLTLNDILPDSRVITIIGKETRNNVLSKYIEKTILVRFDTNKMTPNEIECANF